MIPGKKVGVCYCYRLVAVPTLSIYRNPRKKLTECFTICNDVADPEVSQVVWGVVGQV